MIIHIIIPFVDYNYWLKHFNTQLNEPYNQNLIKVPKVVKPTIKKTLLQVINSPMSPPFLGHGKNILSCSLYYMEVTGCARVCLCSKRSR